VNDLCVVVRSVGERTEEACLQIVQSQLGSESQIHMVKDKPFAEAHLESVRLAADSGAKWSLFLDADVLLRKDAISEMLREAESISMPFYMLNFGILDRGFGGPARGVHLYTTNYLQDALQFREAAWQAQRPESQTCIEVAKMGIPTLSSTQVMGLHGYEQFYADIYRTAFVRAVKSAPFVDYLLRRHRARYPLGGECDQDDKVMFWGLVDGMVYGFDHEKAPLDKKWYRERASQVLAMLNLQEKGPFVLDQDEIERTFREHILDEQYLANEHRICPSARICVPIPDHSLKGRAKRTIYHCLLSCGRRVKEVIASW
jgi:hypothetical protein